MPAFQRWRFGYRHYQMALAALVYQTYGQAHRVSGINSLLYRLGFYACLPALSNRLLPLSDGSRCARLSDLQGGHFGFRE